MAAREHVGDWARSAHSEEPVWFFNTRVLTPLFRLSGTVSTRVWLGQLNMTTVTLPSPVDIVREGERRFPSVWARRHFYIPETEGLIQLQPFQVGVLDYAFKRVNGRFRFDTILISEPKKSGKSTITGVVGRWASEEWGKFGEVLYVGNDLEQAKGRGFAAHKHSIELTPGYERAKGLLPDQWQVLSTEMTHIPSGTKVKATATDYRGEAGPNPIITIWEEMWGFGHTDALRFWAEVAPSPTRSDSVRFIATYAGYEGESELLWGLYQSGVKESRQLTSADIPGFPDGLIPCYVNEAARMFTFWDSGTQARRMPWQQGERGAAYYASEEATQTQQQFRRLHLNEWVSGESEFVPIAWWDACNEGPAPLPEGDPTPLVVALDAAISGDCFGLTAVSRHPIKENAVRVRMHQKWTPAKGSPIDFREPEAALRYVTGHFNVAAIVYDPYQLHDFCTRLAQEGLGYFREFSQGNERLEADGMLYQLIANRRIAHGGEPDLREHIQNCNAKLSKDEDNRLRIIKKAEQRKIDLAVCLSMASYDCLRLNL